MFEKIHILSRAFAARLVIMLPSCNHQDDDSCTALTDSINYNSHVKMSPPATNPGLSSYEIKLIQQLTQQSTRYESQWAFTPPQNPTLGRLIYTRCR